MGSAQRVIYAYPWPGRHGHALKRRGSDAQADSERTRRWAEHKIRDLEASGLPASLTKDGEGWSVVSVLTTGALVDRARLP